MFPVVWAIILPGGTAKATALFEAQYRLSALHKRCLQQLDRIESLPTLTAGRCFTIEDMLAQPVERNSQLGYYTNFINLLDSAAVAVPTGMASNGLPFGVTLAAAAFRDRYLLMIARRRFHLRAPRVGGVPRRSSTSATGEPTCNTRRKAAAIARVSGDTRGDIGAMLHYIEAFLPLMRRHPRCSI